MAVTLLLLLLPYISLVLAEFNIDDSILFKIDFPTLADNSFNGKIILLKSKTTSIFGLLTYTYSLIVPQH